MAGEALHQGELSVSVPGILSSLPESSREGQEKEGAEGGEGERRREEGAEGERRGQEEDKGRGGGRREEEGKEGEGGRMGEEGGGEERRRKEGKGSREAEEGSPEPESWGYSRSMPSSPRLGFQDRCSLFCST